MIGNPHFYEINETNFAIKDGLTRPGSCSWKSLFKYLRLEGRNQLIMYGGRPIRSSRRQYNRC
uniref:Uncharacterized protein n=1 Tax=Picea sitchensis TaxID=3332 RepID=A0A6B9XV33_PICSI|nr:hypothetical protein Q903MT_gene3888 [Picea sitchensis]